MKESTVWFCSDLHLGHKLMTVPYTRNQLATPMDAADTVPPLRPIGYEEKFFEAANAIVKKNDILCILGDIAFSNVAYWFTRLASLPGRKIVLLGNHDKNRLKWYMKFGFTDILPFGHSKLYRHDLGNVLLTHIPAFESVLTSYDDRFIGLAKKHSKEFDGSSCILNLHGHTHGKAIEKHNTFDCSLEVINYVPISIEQIIERKFKN